MKSDDVLGGHQWSELSTDTDTYYLQHGNEDKEISASEIVSEFVVFRNEDKVMINGSEIMNKLSARMRWNYLIKEGWKKKVQ